MHSSSLEHLHPLLALTLLSVEGILTTERLERLSRLLLGLLASVGVAQVGLVSRSLVANVLSGVVDVLVRLAETGRGDALVRDSLSRHVDAEVMCSLICSGW
jgi:hypothetical protein